MAFWTDYPKDLCLLWSSFGCFYADLAPSKKLFFRFDLSSILMGSLISFNSLMLVLFVLIWCALLELLFRIKTTEDNEVNPEE